MVVDFYYVEKWVNPCEVKTSFTEVYVPICDIEE